MSHPDPYREWLVTAPDGAHLDLAEIVARALFPRANTEQLRSLLW